MRNNHTIKIAYTALFMALIFVGTQFLRIPLPFGYFNMGDCLILLSAVIIGGSHAVIASALGAALADILSGYVIYAPATIIIKSLMVIAMITVLRLCRNKCTKSQNILFIAGAALSELIMVCGYLIYDIIIYSFAGALAALPGNVLQGIAAVVTSAIIVVALKHGGLLKRFQL